MRHEWKVSVHIPFRRDDEQFLTWGADSELGALLDGFPVDPKAVDCWPEELLRLAEREKTLAEEVDDQASTIRNLVEDKLALEAEVERYVAESGRFQKAFLLQLDRAVAAETERDRLLAEVERLTPEPFEQGFGSWVEVRCSAVDPTTGDVCVREDGHEGRHRIYPRHPVTPG